MFSIRQEKVKQQKYTDISTQIMVQKIRVFTKNSFAVHSTPLCLGGQHLGTDLCILLMLRNLSVVFV